MLRRYLLTFAVLVVCFPFPVAAQSGGPNAPDPGTLFLYPERIPLEDGSLATAERGLMFVPINRADTSHGVIAIDLWRFPAQSPTDVPPVVLLHGGPGWPGLDGSLENPDYWENVIEPFTAVSDLIVVGQRGIGSSKPNTICENGNSPLILRQCREFWENADLDLSGFTVIEAAADVRDIAHALGEDRVIVWGVSFGSHWGMAVIRYHPDLVARAVLSGMEGPDHTYDRPSGFYNAIERYAAEAEQSEAISRLFPKGIMAAIDSIYVRLGAQPAQVTVEDDMGEERQFSFGAASVPGLIDGYTSNIGSRGAVAGWPADIYRLYTGDFEQVARQRIDAEQDEPSFPPLYRTASYFMLDCGSGITEARLEEYQHDPAIPYVGNRAWYYQFACQAWDSDLGDAFRDFFDTDVPTAIVHGDRDMSTPYENALELAPYFKQSKLVTVMGGSHGALREALRADSAFAEAIWTFVRTGDLGILPDSVELPRVEWEIP